MGALIGLALGLGGGRLHHHVPGGITHRYEGIYALGIGLVAFGLADVTFGNGLVAAFVAAIALGASEHEITDRFADFSENISTIFQVLTFFVFGAIIVATGYDRSVLALLAFIAFALLVARPVAVMGCPRRHRDAAPAQAVHRLVRAEGGGLDAVRDPRARRRDRERGRRCSTSRRS